MDPSLNSDTIQWNKILQTHCEDNAQVSTLFHGVVIWYSLAVKAKTPIKDKMTEAEVELDRLADFAISPFVNPLHVERRKRRSVRRRCHSPWLRIATGAGLVGRWSSSIGSTISPSSWVKWRPI